MMPTSGEQVQEAASGIDSGDLGLRDADSGEVTNPESGIHAILRNTDYWFNMELSQLEKFAITAAREEAEAGLPRQQASADTELPIEQKIRHDAAGLIIAWHDRVRRKIEDGIQSAYVSAGRSLVQLRLVLDELELTFHQLRAKEAALRECENAAIGRERTLWYTSLINRRYYPVLIGFLVLVDWIANVPVFNELLPQEPGAEQRWQDLVAGAEKYGSWSGLHTLLDRILFSPEVSLLALGVVCFLMFLGHVCGKSIRRMTAFQAKDEPSLTLGLRSHRRQAYLPFLVSTCGILLVILFLYLSRGQLEKMTTLRLTQANNQVAKLQLELDKAESSKDFDEDQSLRLKLSDAQTTADERLKRANYASGISRMNFPIMLLNLVLALTATAAAYLHDQTRIVETRLFDPRMSSLKEDIMTYRQEILTQRQRWGTLNIEIEEQIAQAKYLAQSCPMRASQAKIQRLEGLVSLFRSENARLRGIDVRNIAAFQEDRKLEYRAIDENESFLLPPEIEALEEELETNRSRFKAFQTTSWDSHRDGVNA
jgi:hypothetical protein